MSEKITKFTVDRNTWLRGVGSDFSALLNEEGKKCCLGFLSLACGRTTEEIAGRKQVDELTEPDKNPNLSWLAVQNNWSGGRKFRASEEGRQIMEINDDEEMADDYREAKLTEQFAEQGITVEFIN